MQRRQFTEAEAEAKIGTQVRALLDFDSVPAGTTGIVVAVMHIGGGFDLGIRWDLMSGSHSRLPRSWVARDEYERFLEEITTTSR